MHCNIESMPPLSERACDLRFAFMQVLFFRHTIDELNKLLGNCHAAADAARESEGGGSAKPPAASAAGGDPAPAAAAGAPSATVAAAQ